MMLNLRCNVLVMFACLGLVCMIRFDVILVLCLNCSCGITRIYRLCAQGASFDDNSSPFLELRTVSRDLITVGNTLIPTPKYSFVTYMYSSVQQSGDLFLG